jgi:hypothetical protein
MLNLVYVYSIGTFKMTNFLQISSYLPISAHLQLV